MPNRLFFSRKSLHNDCWKPYGNSALLYFFRSSAGCSLRAPAARRSDPPRHQAPGADRQAAPHPWRPPQETRGAGYEYLHIAVDDHSGWPSPPSCRPGHHSAMRFFLMARAYYAGFGISVACTYRQRLLLPRPTVRLAAASPTRQTPPHPAYTPRTNGKAERFIQTAMREWAYARTYQHSLQRHEQLDLWLHDYKSTGKTR